MTHIWGKTEQVMRKGPASKTLRDIIFRGKEWKHREKHIDEKSRRYLEKIEAKSKAITLRHESERVELEKLLYDLYSAEESNEKAKKLAKAKSAEIVLMKHHIRHKKRHR